MTTYAMTNHGHVMATAVEGHIDPAHLASRSADRGGRAMTTARIGGREYSGRNLGSIVRREFGRRAGVRLSADRNTPEIGVVVTWSEPGGAWITHGRVTSLDGELGDVEPRRGPREDER